MCSVFGFTDGWLVAVNRYVYCSCCFGFTFLVCLHYLYWMIFVGFEVMLVVDLGLIDIWLFCCVCACVVRVLLGYLCYF